MKFELPTPDSVAGSILVAVPDLRDPNFHQTVVYVAEHNKEGAFGLVMNRPLGKTLRDVADIPGIPDALADVRVFSGGPVNQENLLLAFFVPGGTEDEIACRLDLPLDEAEDILRGDAGWVRAFSGYAGWGEGQLDGELEAQAWKVCPPDPVLFEEKYLQGLWSVYVSDDNRWRGLLPFLPEDPGRN